MADTDFPLLVFPDPVPADRARRFGGGGKVKVPEPARQAQRLVPQFQRLQQAMDRHRLALQGNLLGLVPEQVLVLETIGTVDNFVRAVENVPGLEWLADYELDDIAPAHGFEDEKKPDKRLKGQIFLVMTEQRALHELQRLFGIWREDPDTSFPRGLAPLRQAFRFLHTIRPWDVDDRIRETGVLEDWQDRIEHEGQ